MNVIDKIGVPALLEQTAEESVELAHACLKLARKIRGENPTPKTKEELCHNLNEEIADIRLCIDTMIDELVDVVSIVEIMNVTKYKDQRWKERLAEKLLNT